MSISIGGTQDREGGHPEHWLRNIELLHLPNHNTKPSNGGINHVMGSHGHLDFETFVCRVHETFQESAGTGSQGQPRDFDKANSDWP